MSSIRLWIAGVAACVVVLPSVGQVRVHGLASERGTAEPLRGVRIDLREPNGHSTPQFSPTWTDSSGGYSIDDVPSGVWAVQATYRDASHEYVLAAPAVEIERIDVALHFEFDFPRMPRHRMGMRIVGREARPDGRLSLGGTILDGNSGLTVQGIRIHLLEESPDDPPDRHFVRDSTTSDDSGHFLFPERTPGRYALRFTGSSHLAITSEPDYLAGTVGVVVRIPPRDVEPDSTDVGGGRIVDGSGRTLARTRSARRRMTDGVIIGRVRDGGRAAHSAAVELVGARRDRVRTNRHGQFEIERVRPGSYSLRVTVSGLVTEFSGLEVRVGGNDVTLDL